VEPGEGHMAEGVEESLRRAWGGGSGEEPVRARETELEIFFYLRRRRPDGCKLLSILMEAPLIQQGRQ
jgi:hypothetical protein